MPERIVPLTLRERELLDLERILMDHDKDEAFRFTRDVVMKKVEEFQKQHCKPPDPHTNTP